MTLQLSARTLAGLADRPRARELVRSVWDRLDELERAGHDLGAIAALRSVLVHHQPTSAGRCPTCRRGTWRHLWRHRPFPCVAWIQVHFELRSAARLRDSWEQVESRDGDHSDP